MLWCIVNLGDSPYKLEENCKTFDYLLKIKTTYNCILKKCYGNIIVTNDSWVVKNCLQLVYTICLMKYMYKSILILRDN